MVTPDEMQAIEDDNNAPAMKEVEDAIDAGIRADYSNGYADVCLDECVDAHGHTLVSRVVELYSAQGWHVNRSPSYSEGYWLRFSRL